MNTIFIFAIVIAAFIFGFAVGYGLAYDASVILTDYPAEKQPSVNRQFIERYRDRRAPDQTWAEQVTNKFNVNEK